MKTKVSPVLKIMLFVSCIVPAITPSTCHGDWLRLLTSSTPTPNIGVSADLLFLAALGVLGLTTDGMITNPKARFYTKCGVAVLVYAAWRTAGGYKGIQETSQKAVTKTKQFFGFGKKDKEAQQPTPVTVNDQEQLPQENTQSSAQDKVSE